MPILANGYLLFRYSALSSIYGVCTNNLKASVFYLSLCFLSVSLFYICLSVLYLSLCFLSVSVKSICLFLIYLFGIYISISVISICLFYLTVWLLFPYQSVYVLPFCLFSVVSVLTFLSVCLSVLYISSCFCVCSKRKPTRSKEINHSVIICWYFSVTFFVFLIPRTSWILLFLLIYNQQHQNDPLSRIRLSVLLLYTKYFRI